MNLLHISPEIPDAIQITHHMNAYFWHSSPAFLEKATMLMNIMTADTILSIENTTHKTVIKTFSSKINHLHCYVWAILRIYQ